MARAQDKNSNNGANLGFEPKLWAYGPLKGNTNSGARITCRLGVA